MNQRMRPLPGVVVVSTATTYELYALATGRVPTISGHVKQLSRHRITRYGVMFGMGYLLHHLLVGNED